LVRIEESPVALTVFGEKHQRQMKQIKSNEAALDRDGYPDRDAKLIAYGDCKCFLHPPGPTRFEYDLRTRGQSPVTCMDCRDRLGKMRKDGTLARHLAQAAATRGTPGVTFLSRRGHRI
jgi:hypothetical protein